MKKLFFILASLASFNTIIFSSCTKDKVQEPDPTAGLTKQAQGYVEGAATKYEIYTKEASIKTGYTKLYFALYDSATGARIDDAHIHLHPMMDMGMMQHSAPYENPEADAVNHLFSCAVVFTMASSAGTWKLHMEIHNHVSNKEGEAEVVLTVADPAKPTVKTFTATSGDKYIVALVDPAFPKVGINDLELAVFKKVDMMNFPADSSMTITLYPEMPSMGHSSPNNVNPVHVSNGHYKGKVNFTMTGLWKLNLDFISTTAVTESSQYFEVEF